MGNAEMALGLAGLLVPVLLAVAGHSSRQANRISALEIDKARIEERISDLREKVADHNQRLGPLEGHIQNIIVALDYIKKWVEKQEEKP
jgi:hypothetical protein